jgi:phosphoglycolate phosphatase-like HAD superfamily hydrolase
LAAHLVLFDLDGTLVHSQSVDSEIYVRSLGEVFGFADVDSDWSGYRHTTDSGILQETFQLRLGRAPTVREVSAFRAHFVAGITAAAAQAPFREIPGAGQALRHIGAAQFYHIGLATGGWSQSARCKMSSAGLCYDAFPSASADDAIARTAIMQLAIARSLKHVRGRRFDTMVYVGDGIWDARACRELEIPFVGIATGKHADTLRGDGAAQVLDGYSDMEEVWSALLRAARKSE